MPATERNPNNFDAKARVSAKQAIWKELDIIGGRTAYQIRRTVSYHLPTLTQLRAIRSVLRPLLNKIAKRKRLERKSERQRRKEARRHDR